MNNNRLGCLSPTAILSAIITLAIVLGLELFSGNGMFSAGSLNAQTGNPLGGVSSHAEIGNDCARCHPAFWSSDHLANRCMACHTNIKGELSDAAALHGILRGDQTTLNCRPCHPEHRGPAAALTELDLKNFPHEKLGFALNAHLKKADGSPLTCNDCHISGQYTNFEIATCKNCHAQMDNTFTLSHSLGFGDDCLACHDGLETYGKNFDHTQMAFVLTGQHLELLCTQCHLNARSLNDLKSTPQNCANCHLKDDAHQGRFGTNCGVCHSAEGWKPAQFDHNLANFKLIGKHNDVKCEECHQNEVYRGTSMDCVACHAQDDEHNGQFGTDCGICHTPTDWDDVTVDHNLFAFQLTGAHIKVKCEQCHTNDTFKGTPTECGQCHAKDDEHAGRFGLNCGLCHSTNAWEPATFDHTLAKFQLTGSHSNVACEKCHINGQYQGTASACAACHNDPAFHAGMFPGQNCDICHNTSAWRPAQYNGPHTFPMNHGDAKTCADCHQPTLTTWTCYTCHNQSEMISKHSEKGISNFDNCLECHPTGQEGEGGGGDY